MITIKDIAYELEGILNGTSANVPEGVTRPFDGLFSVRTEGYHLDNVTDYQEGKNFFPVFIGEPTGDFNPISGLEQMDMEVPVSIYFPVRFKSKMLDMQKFITDVFIGRAIGFGAVDGKYSQYGFCNVSIAELGEITDMDVDQFGNSILKGLNEFIEEQYKMPVHTSEPWIALNFSLYLSTMKNALSTSEDAPIYGNAYAVYLKYKDWQETIVTDKVAIAYGGQTESQQAFALGTGSSETSATSLVVSASLSFTFEAVVKRNAFYHEIVKGMLNGNLDLNDFEFQIALKDEFKSGEDTDYADFEMSSGLYAVSNISTNLGVNEPLALTFTIGPRAEVQ